MQAEFSSENLKERDHLGNQGFDGRLISERILKEEILRKRREFIRFRKRCSAGSCEHDNKPSDSVKVGEFHCLREHQRFKKDCFTELISQLGVYCGMITFDITINTKVNKDK
jgi:hypothetical protein